MTEKLNKPGSMGWNLEANTIRKLEPNGDHLGSKDEESISPVRVAPDENCTHHWIIETPNGSTSHGICKHCGGEKDYANSCLTIAPEYRRSKTGSLKYTYGCNDLADLQSIS